MTTSQATTARVLVIDDSLTVRMSLRDLFVEPGYEVLLAEGGDEGIRLLRAENVDVVILDLLMPGKSGVDTLREIKADEKLASVPVILLTAVTNRSDLVACLDVGADDFVTKPWDESELLGRLGAMVRLKRALDAEVTAKVDAQAADRLKGEFLANMSHKIRTPITAILGFAENLLDPDLSDTDKLDAAYTIHHNGEHLLQIINDILDLSKIEAGKLETERIACSPIQVAVDVRSLMQSRASAKNLSLEIEYVSAVPEHIRSDPTRLKQILVNLIGNAIKFTATGGVRLVIRFLGQNPTTAQLQFDVIDTGIGMTAEQIAGLFRPFTQADTSTNRMFGGTGLGLTISKRLANLLGGDVVVAESEPGQGSRFRVTVATGALDQVKMLHNPRSATSVKPEVSADPTPDGSKLDCRILLAEDGPDNQRLIAHILRKAGAEVTLVENGKLAVDAALAAMRRRRDGDPQSAFDVILMDMQMPVMDGYEATGQLRQKGYTGPIIALTAHAMAGDRQNCINAGCDDYATKPIDRKVMIEMIRKYLQPAATSV